VKIATCHAKTGERQFVAASRDGSVFVDLTSLTDADVAFPSDMLTFLAGGEGTLARATVALDRAMAPSSGIKLWSPEELTFLPAVPRPGKILHTSVNFSAHKKEVASKFKSDEWKSHDWGSFHYKHPTGFLQAPSSTVGTGGTVIIPKFTEQLDYEIELAIVIGKKAKDVRIEDALEFVAGYCIFNDMSARDIQAREHSNKVILLGKSFDTSCPLGPWITTKDEISDPQNLKMELRVNGEIRQDSNTSDMVYGVRELVSWWSQITLEPGDIITSGRPSGVIAGQDKPVWLAPGDRIDASIEGLGTLTNTIAAA
jgi:acylpyruvate hydrolase